MGITHGEMTELKQPAGHGSARLVVIISIISTSVERVFSQVKFIIETIGERGIHETLELRVMERVNKYD
eukprot:scaffold12347_cov63-Skeletonema_menzelii.AAC.1